MDLGSVDEAIQVANTSRDAQRIQDDAAERCTMPYRAPELFQVSTGERITQASDIWVSSTDLWGLDRYLLRSTWASHNFSSTV